MGFKVLVDDQAVWESDVPAEAVKGFRILANGNQVGYVAAPVNVYTLTLVPDLISLELKPLDIIHKIPEWLERGIISEQVELTESGETVTLVFTKKTVEPGTGNDIPAPSDTPVGDSVKDSGKLIDKVTDLEAEEV